jgi:hypothetical protein
MWALQDERVSLVHLLGWLELGFEDDFCRCCFGGWRLCFQADCLSLRYWEGERCRGLTAEVEVEVDRERRGHWIARVAACAIWTRPGMRDEKDAEVLKHSTREEDRLRAQMRVVCCRHARARI